MSRCSICVYAVAEGEALCMDCELRVLGEARGAAIALGNVGVAVHLALLAELAEDAYLSVTIHPDGTERVYHSMGAYAFRHGRWARGGR